MNSGYDVLEEPSIPTEAGIRKPDVVAFRDGVAYVVSVTIVADNAVLDHAHLEKSNIITRRRYGNGFVTDETAIKQCFLVQNGTGGVQCHLCLPPRFL